MASGNKKDKQTNSGRELLGVTIIIVSVFFLLNLIIPKILGDVIGQGIYNGATGFLGVFAYVFFTVLLIAGYFIMRGYTLAVSKKRTVYVVVLSFLALMLLQLVTTHYLLELEFGEYTSAVWDFQENTNTGGVRFGAFAYGMSSAASRIGAYIILSILFTLFALLLCLDIFGKGRGAVRSKKSRKRQRPFAFGGEVTPVNPISNSGLFVDEIISRRPRGKAGKFSDFEGEDDGFSERNQENQGAKGVGEFFDSIRHEESNEARAAKEILFGDKDQALEESVEKFYGRINREREMPRPSMPKSAAASPDIKKPHDDFEVNIRKTEGKKRMPEVVFLPPKDLPRAVEGDIINAEEYSRNLKAGPEQKMRPDYSSRELPPDEFEPRQKEYQDDQYYDDGYRFEDKTEKAQRFVQRPETPHRAAARPDVRFTQQGNPSADDIINCENYGTEKDENTVEYQDKEPDYYGQETAPEYEDNFVTQGFDDKGNSNEIINADYYADEDNGLGSKDYDYVDESALQDFASENDFDVGLEHEIEDGQSFEKAYEAIQSEIENTQNAYESEAEIENADSYLEQAVQNASDEQSGAEQDEAQDDEPDEAYDGEQAGSYRFLDDYDENVLPAQEKQEEPEPAASESFAEKVKRIESEKQAQNPPARNEAAIQKAAERAAKFAAERAAQRAELQAEEFSDEDHTGYYLKEMPPENAGFVKRIAEIEQNFSPKNANQDGEAPPKRKGKSSRYVSPPTTLLISPPIEVQDEQEDFESNRTILEETLRSLKLPAKVIGSTKGPQVTRYELEMPMGMPIKKIEGFAQDIAYSLATSSGIRIEAPIPGKRAVGIEVPNDVVQKVCLRELIENPQFQKESSKLTLCLGKDIAGKNIYAPLEKMPHLLIAGSTGSGKSVCLQSLIISMIYKSSPDDVRLVLVDTKMVEFSLYKGLPHLLVGKVIMDREHAINAFKWVRDEVKRRYEAFMNCSVRSLAEYNMCEAVKSGEMEKLPSIVIVVDELNDLMSSAHKKEMEDLILSIAQIGRASGVHLILATQRPSVDVITGTIKVNFPCRIGLLVSSATDSKIILDQSGAENLLGNGDLLYSGGLNLKRIQGAYVDKTEVEEVVRFVSQNNTAEAFADAESMIMRKAETQKEEGGDSAAGADPCDPALEEVVRKIIETQTASTSTLQRRFRMGYARASRIIDQLEEFGFIGPADPSRPTKGRDVYITREMFKDFFGKDY